MTDQPPTSVMAKPAAALAPRFRSTIRRSAHGYMLQLVSPSGGAAAQEFRSQGEALSSIPTLYAAMTMDLPLARGLAADTTREAA